jgi:hypothetical protein
MAYFGGVSSPRKLCETVIEGGEINIKTVFVYAQ